MQNNNLINQELGMFSYKDPELWNDENIYDETQAPWFYHINNLLDLNKEDLINIKNIIDNDKKRGVIYNSILDVIDFQTYYGIMRKINSNMNSALSVYLFSCKYFLKKYSKEPDTDGRVKFVFIFGNNTSDLDSVCSSIIYSFFLYIWYSLKGKIDKGSEDNTLMFFVPVINIKRSDMRLKILEKWWLERCEIKNPEEILVFNDNEHLLNVLKYDYKYYICLVDFNNFEANNIYNGDNVKSIIDHHVYKGTGENHRITKSIYPICVCSCMVIISYLYKHSSDFLGVPFVNKSILWLMYGAILKDSNNFIKRDLGKRWIQSDLDIFMSLKKNFKISNKMDIYITYLFNTIRFSIDLKTFGIENVLFSDYKDYNYFVSEKKIKIRVSSIDFSIDFLFSHENSDQLVEKMYNLCYENDFSMFILIGSYLNNYKLQKDVSIVFYKNDVDRDDLMNTLLVNEEIKLSKKGYKSIKFGDNIQNFDIYQINNLSYSRKRLENFLTTYFS
ncbi:conserved Plasmodium protein, unknown function [Plasmodium yoelii]|nr:conserved Plasmodium protein, unknown function [Plasmodium yoelii]CDU85253.1 conserved Plasmodium protein, unknown function [Plasmodium yoelii]VTZ79148.1 conserved Plasmodium protein, unknown function [Plasmodium yoelii]|eukprot:XP_022813419.1 conserved Plasmodium protein, unknown function [Plasmodium yoelii]